MYQDNGSFAEGYAIGRDSNGNNNGFGNGWEGLIGLALVASLFGFGGNGNVFGNRGGSYGSPCATEASLAAGFANSSILSNLNDLILGQAQMQNFINQGFAGVNNAMNVGFAGVNNAICNLGYTVQGSFNEIGHQISDCCCSTKQAIADVKYANERQTCDIIQAINAGNQRLVDIYTTDKINALTAENTALKGQISNDRQTANIVSQLRDPGCPVASYLVPNPNCCYNPFGFGYGFNGYNNGCCGSVL